MLEQIDKESFEKNWKGRMRKANSARYDKKPENKEILKSPYKLT